MSLNDLLTHAADLLEGEARALKECHSRRDGEWHLARPADHSAKRDHDDMMQTASELRSLLTRPEAQGETPRTDAARRAHARWCEYAKQYGNMPEAMEQAPPEADPFYIAEELERELSAKRHTPDLGMIPDALERADKAVRVLSTILKNAKLMEGFAVADEILADILCARKEVAHIESFRSQPTPQAREE